MWWAFWYSGDVHPWKESDWRKPGLVISVIIMGKERISDESDDYPAPLKGANYFNFENNIPLWNIYLLTSFQDLHKITRRIFSLVPFHDTNAHPNWMLSHTHSRHGASHLCDLPSFNFMPIKSVSMPSWTKKNRTFTRIV